MLGALACKGDAVVLESSVPDSSGDSPVDSDTEPVDTGPFDADGDGVVAADDCDDSDPSRGAASVWYPDADGDGYGDAEQSLTACDRPEGMSTQAGDCDDRDARIAPGATEVCDGLDNDCDGLVDDGDPDVVAELEWFVDGDGDGYGSGARSVRACSEPSGYCDNADDCDDSDAARSPGATEVYDGVDQDCDGGLDEGVYPNDCAEVLAVDPRAATGAYTIDPGGAGAPFAVECQMTMDGGGWTRAVPPYLAHLRAGARREYLYSHGAAWYRSPQTTLVWDWAQFQPLDGDYAYSNGGAVSGTFVCVHAEDGHWGVGCSNGPGGTSKVLPIYVSDSALGTSTVCQDQPDVFGVGTCQADAEIWVREL